MVVAVEPAPVHGWQESHSGAVGRYSTAFAGSLLDRVHVMKPRTSAAHSGCPSVSRIFTFRRSSASCSAAVAPRRTERCGNAPQWQKHDLLTPHHRPHLQRYQRFVLRGRSNRLRVSTTYRSASRATYRARSLRRDHAVIAAACVSNAPLTSPPGQFLQPTVQNFDPRQNDIDGGPLHVRHVGAPGGSISMLGRPFSVPAMRRI